MPYCSAANCHNAASKGFSMRAFPRDPARRSLWAAKVNRLNWKPTNNSRLCEVHFDGDQWEKQRMDGKKKLKCNAVPTLFEHIKPLKRRSPTTDSVKDRRISPTDSIIQPLTSYDHQYSNVSKTDTLRRKSKRKPKILISLAKKQNSAASNVIRSLICPDVQPATNYNAQHSDISETGVLIKTKKRKLSTIPASRAKERMSLTNNVTQHSTSYDHQYSSVSKAGVLARTLKKKKKPSIIRVPPTKDKNKSQVNNVSYPLANCDNQYSSVLKSKVLARKKKAFQSPLIEKRKMCPTANDTQIAICSDAENVTGDNVQSQSASQTNVLIRALQEKLEKIEKIVQEQQEYILYLWEKLNISAATRRKKGK